MTTEPKPYTLAEWRARLSPNIFEMIQEELRERGLIAEEPVDSLLEKAVELVGLWLPDETELRHEAIDLALTALRCGMELQREKLTREMVLKAHWHATGAETVEANLIDRLHAALTEALQ